MKTIERMNAKEFAELEKSANEKIKARNRTETLIRDALARYVKEKTRAKSRKAAMEKDAAIRSPRFKKIEEYDRREDIREAYGIGMITDSQADKLEDLWDEREELKAKSVDGVYADLVTECMDKVLTFAAGLFEDDLVDFDEIRIAWEKQLKESEELHARMHEDYKAWKNGWTRNGAEK